LSLPEDRKATIPTATAVEVQKQTPRVVKRRAARKEEPKSYQQSDSYQHFIKVYKVRVADVLKKNNIPEESVRNVTYINRGVCCLTMAVGNKKFMTLGNIHDWWDECEERLNGN